MSTPSMRVKRTADPRLADIAVLEVSDIEDASIQAEVTTSDELLDARVIVVSEVEDADEFIYVAEGPQLWLPSDEPTLKVWLESIDVEGAEGASVSTWTNRTGSNHFTQNTAANRPTVQHNQFLGKRSIRFDGSNDVLRNGAGFLSGQTGSVFIVAKPVSVTNFGAIFASSDEASDTRAILFNNNGSSKLRYQQQNADTADQLDGSTTLVANAIHLLEWHSSGTAISQYVNRVNQTLSVVNGANNGDWFADIPARDNVTIGAWHRSSGIAAAPFSGHIGVILVFDGSPLTEDLQQKVWRYLRENNWGV